MNSSSEEPANVATSGELATFGNSNNSNSSNNNNTLVTVPSSTMVGPVAIPRILQAVPRGGENPTAHTAIVNIDSVYPMHMRLRSLSAAAEAARLRGQAALRVLNNDAAVDASVTRTSGGVISVSKGILRPEKRTRFCLDSTGLARLEESEMYDGVASLETTRGGSPDSTLVSQGAITHREFDLGEFALYRNDIVFKLRGLGPRSGNRRRKRLGRRSSRGRDQVYDNMDADGGSISYDNYYGGGESEI